MPCPPPPTWNAQPRPKEDEEQNEIESVGVAKGTPSVGSGIWMDDGGYKIPSIPGSSTGFRWRCWRGGRWLIITEQAEDRKEKVVNRVISLRMSMIFYIILLSWWMSFCSDALLSTQSVGGCWVRMLMCPYDEWNAIKSDQDKGQMMMMGESYMITSGCTKRDVEWTRIKCAEEFW